MPVERDSVLVVLALEATVFASPQLAEDIARVGCVLIETPR